MTLLFVQRKENGMRGGNIRTMSMSVRFALRASSKAKSVPQRGVECPQNQQRKCRLQNHTPNLQNQSLCGESTVLYFLVFLLSTNDGA